MVKYNLKYNPSTINSKNNAGYQVVLTKKSPSGSQKQDISQETSSISLYDVFRVVRNIVGVYISVYILGSVNKYVNKN